MEVLIRAEAYALERGDDLWFKNLYTLFREEYSVKDAVWKALSHLYDNATADQLVQQSTGLVNNA